MSGAPPRGLRRFITALCHRAVFMAYIDHQGVQPLSLRVHYHPGISLSSPCRRPSPTAGTRFRRRLIRRGNKIGIMKEGRRGAENQPDRLQLRVSSGEKPKDSRVIGRPCRLSHHRGPVVFVALSSLRIPNSARLESKVVEKGRKTEMC